MISWPCCLPLFPRFGLRGLGLSGNNKIALRFASHTPSLLMSLFGTKPQWVEVARGPGAGAREDWWGIPARSGSKVPRPVPEGLVTQPAWNTVPRPSRRASPLWPTGAMNQSGRNACVHFCVHMTWSVFGRILRQSRTAITESDDLVCSKTNSERNSDVRSRNGAVKWGSRWARGDVD